VADLFGLCLAAGRMGAHVQPNLQDVSNWNAVADDCGAEDGFLMSLERSKANG